MEKVQQIRKCYNCGTILQSQDSTKEGYVNKETLDNAVQSFIFCNECFEKERYHQDGNQPFLTLEFTSMLKKAKESNALIVYLVNLFSFEGSFSNIVSNLINGLDIIVVGNKFDLLPKGTSESKIIDYVAKHFKDNNIEVKKENIVISNSEEVETARPVLEKIYELKNKRDVYIIGSKQAGKSTLISAILKIYSNLSNGNIVTHRFESDSDSAIIEIPFNSKSSMFDTPGIPDNNSIRNGLTAEHINKIKIKDHVEKRSFELSKGKSLFIGGLAIISLLDGPKTPINGYFSPEVDVVKIKECESIEEKFISMINKNKLEPITGKVASTKDLDIYEITIADSCKKDIGVLGLGWVTFIGNGQKFRIYVPHGVSIYHSDTKVEEDE